MNIYVVEYPMVNKKVRVRKVVVETTESEAKDHAAHVDRRRVKVTKIGTADETVAQGTVINEYTPEDML